MPNAAIVGYTNAGKSSLLRNLTGADVLVEDKLFATLDTTTRKIALPNKQPLLLTDTVGFVRKLPHRLVEAFNATLEEAVLADFLIHLLDASQPEVMKFYETTRKVLSDLGADEKRILIVFNKIDKITDPSVIPSLRHRFPDSLFISIKTGEGIDALVQRIAAFVEDDVTAIDVQIPQSRSDLIARLHREAVVLSTNYWGNDVLMSVRVSRRTAKDYAEYTLKEALSAA